jgi:sugar lactone lactonase YvrE
VGGRSKIDGVLETTPKMKTLLAGLAFGESPRWHGNRLWLADWGAQQILAVDLDGHTEVIVRVRFPSFALSFDWLPDGRVRGLSH